ncbi:diacylglycerol kinase theta isoform X4 [Camelus ferus]|uniref:Diacylglycerol kinase theta n=2 Tax=Camelus TaxID=9836 RepID=A0A8B8TZH6_CAMFR|nr:diacylglycerol kinase theta isoform X4 [Camelus ferus]
MAAAAESGARAWLSGGSPRPGSPTSSPELGAGSRSRLGPGSGPGSGIERPGARPPGPSAPGHSFRKVTLTKPTFCHLCSDFIWGLAGILCDVCNFMSHEKCVKHVKTPCTSVAPSLVRVPVAHCFGPRGHYKRKFCAVCRKGLEAPALRCEVCELHVHPECVPFACSDCRQCHLDGHRDPDTHHHHWREGNLSSGARCEFCRKTCSSSDVLAGVRCEWCGVQAHSVCSAVLTPECTFGRLRTMVLPPACVRLLSRNFSKMHCFRISESAAPEPGDGDDGVDGSAPAGPGKEVAAPESSKQTLKIFDGNDTVQRNHFRVISVPRLARSQEVLEAALRAYYITEDPQAFQLQALPPPTQAGDADTEALGKVWSGGTAEDEGSRGPGSRDVPEAWVIRALPRTQEVLKIYPAWLKVGVAYVSLRVTPQSTAQTVVLEVLPLLGRQDEGPEGFQLLEVLMGSRQVQRMVLADEELLLGRLQAIRQTSLRQMSQTRFYVAERRAVAPRVSLFVGGLPPGLSPQEYSSLLDEAMSLKAGLVSMSHVYSSQGAVVLDVACFAEAERLYMLVRDTAVHSRPLTALVLPDVLHTKLPPDCCPLLVFVNPKSGGLKGRDLLCSFRKLLNPHQVFELTNGGPLPGYPASGCWCVEGMAPWAGCSPPWRRCGTVWPAKSLPWPSCPWAQGMTWAGSSAGGRATVERTHSPCCCRWTRLTLCSWTAGPSCWTLRRLVEGRAVWWTQSRPRLHNKGVYVRVGLQKLSQARGLHREIRLQVEQQEVELPSIEGLIFINIPSWGSGADLWGSDSDSKFEKPRMDDGLLEVVGVTGVVHMGQVQGGLRSGIRIAQGSYFRVTLLKATPVQVDGEPWVQAPGHMIISAAGPKVHMLRKAKQKPRKAGTPRDARVDGEPAPEGDSK